MFVNRGDYAMPSVALTLARFSAKHGRGMFGDNLFANVVLDPTKKDGKNMVVYYDSDDDKMDGGAVRLLNREPSWYIDRMVVSSSAADTATANALMRRHINFLCSIRGEPVRDDDTHEWFYIVHVAVLGRIRRPGRTSAGMDLYEAALRVVWRPLSPKDDCYDDVVAVPAGGDNDGGEG